MNRRAFVQNSIFTAFLPWVGRPAETTLEPIYLDVPSFVNTLNLTNPCAYRDRMGVIFASTRADSSIGGVVWRVDGYVDKDHRGVISPVIPTDPERHPEPEKYFANGNLVIWPDGRLYFVTIEVNNLQERKIIAQVIYPVPGWTV